MRVLNTDFRIGARARGLIISLVALAAALAPLVAQPFSPSFWDPARRPQRPDTSGLHIIRFLTEDEYPPFDFITPEGALVGFNVDLARAICEELKVACTIQARRWDNLLDALDQNQGDAIVVAIQWTGFALDVVVRCTLGAPGIDERGVREEHEIAVREIHKTGLCM